jgi:hypothetical protein
MATLVLLQGSPALAHVGGPYSNNTHDGLQGGVFQGTFRMKNGSGVFRFSTGVDPFLSPVANCVVFHQGIVYAGDCFGTVDYVSKTVSGITNGAAGGTGAQVNPTVFPTGGGGISQGQVNYVFNSEWSGKITKTAPSVRFKIKGWGYVFNPGNVSVTNTFTSQDWVQVLPGDPPVTVVFHTDTTTSETTQPKITSRVKIRGFGGRITPIAYTGIGTATPTP